MLEIYPASPSGHNNIGVIIRDRGRWREAVRHFRRAVELAPSYETAYTNLGEAYIKLGRPDAAHHALRQALDLNPRNRKAQTLFNGLKQ